MDNAEYWRKRAIEREEQWHKKSQETIEKELALQYEATLHHLNKEIESLYAKFAKDNAISMHKARKLIQGSEHRVWRMDIEEYIKAIDKTGDKGLLRELNTLAMRSRISRLDKLYGETLMELDKLGRYTSERTRQFLHDAYEKNRTDTAKDYLTKGEGPVNVKVDPKRIEDVLRHPWSGKVYSQRIWRGMDRLSKAIKEEIVNGVHRGDSIDKMTKRIQERMDVSRRDAVRLVRTEMSYVNNQAALDSIKGAKMKYFRFIATVDKRTSATCKDHNDHVYAIEDAQIGTNVPPLHPHCRSTIAGTLRGPAIDGKEPTKVAQSKVAEVEDAKNAKLDPPTAKIIIHNDSVVIKEHEFIKSQYNEVIVDKPQDLAMVKIGQARVQTAVKYFDRPTYSDKIRMNKNLMPISDEFIKAERLSELNEYRLKKIESSGKTLEDFKPFEYTIGKDEVERWFTDELDGKKRPLYPPNDGAVGETWDEELAEGTMVSRYGDTRGSYMAPYGTPFVNRAMPDSEERYIDDNHTYIVVKAFPVKVSVIAPAFGKEGGGLQYKTDEDIQYYLDNGFLEERNNDF